MTTRRGALKQVEAKGSDKLEGTKMYKRKSKEPSSGINEGESVMFKKEEDAESLLKEENDYKSEAEEAEEEDLTDFITMNNLALLHKKLQAQQEAAESVAAERQRALEAKLQALMMLLANTEE